MRFLLPTIACILLNGCASMEATQNCQKQAGPKPYAGADAFGLLGALTVNQTDDRQAWNKKMDDCMAAWRAKRDAEDKVGQK